MSNNLIGFGSLEGLGGSCGCAGRRAGMAGFGAGPDGLGAGPDGIGSTTSMSNAPVYTTLAVVGVAAGTMGYFIGGAAGKRMSGKSPAYVGLVAGAFTGLATGLASAVLTLTKKA